MKYKNNVLKLLKIGFILLLVYIVIGVCHFFVFSDKLTYDELVVVTEYYEEIRPVNTAIKNDFYVDALLKVLDKEYILEELRKDTLTYSITVINNSFEMFKETVNARTTNEYVYRCYLDFDKFVGLENATELFDLTVSFYGDSAQTITDLETFATFMDEIVGREYSYLSAVSQEKNTITLWVVVSYFVLLIVCYFVNFNKIKENINNKVNSNKKGDKK